jgi:long-chain acyl-CoA synthetase
MGPKMIQNLRQHRTRNSPGYDHLPDILISASRAFPQRKAIIFGRKKFTYQDLYKKSSGVACGLKENGIKKGERVALLLDNSPEFVFSYFGALMAGAIVVPINHMFKRDEIKYILEDSESSCLITSSVYTETAQELNVIVDSLKYVFYTNQEAPNALSLVPYLAGRNITTSSWAESGLQRNDTAVFLYTSGTTGHPKAAMLTHDNLLANAASASRLINVNPKDTFICFLPLFHSFAATVCMIMPLYKGSRVVILKSPRPIKKLLRSIRKNRITIFVGIPSIYSILKDIKLPKFLPRFLLRLFNPIRLAISGAAALPVKVFLSFEKKYGIPLLEGYGLTEASPVVSLNPLRGRRKGGSIGLPLPDVSVKIIDDKDRQLGAEEVGELCVKGPNVMQGYFKKDKETQETLKNSWLLTGDMAKIDSDGYITIMGRKKEMVNVRGLNVYPREIEEVLYQNPNIKEAAVIGIPDPHKGEAPKGFVVLKAGADLTEHEIILYLRQHLALYKVPKQIEIRNDLPKNASGKILKRLLMEEERP